MENLEDILVPLGFFTTILLIVYFSMKFSFQIKNKIINSGGKVEINKHRSKVFEISGVAIGIGIGLLISGIISEMDISKNSQEMISGALILLFGGIGLLTGSVLKTKIEKRDSDTRR